MSRQTDRCGNEEREKAHHPPQMEKTHLRLGRSVPARGVTTCNAKCFWTTVREPWKRRREHPPGFEDAAFQLHPAGMGREAGNTVPRRKGIAAHPCTCPKTPQGGGGDERTCRPSVCQTQMLRHPKLTDAAGATECASQATSEPRSPSGEAGCHGRGWSTLQSKLCLQPQSQTFTDSLLPRCGRNEAEAVFIHRGPGRKMK